MTTTRSRSLNTPNRLHTDLAKATRLRGYVQIETPAIAAGLKDITGLIGSEHIPATYPDGTAITDTNGKQVYFVHKPHYLGPVILAAKRHSGTHQSHQLSALHRCHWQIRGFREWHGR